MRAHSKRLRAAMVAAAASMLGEYETPGHRAGWDDVIASLRARLALLSPDAPPAPAALGAEVADRIIPARFLKCVTFDALGPAAFADDRAELAADPAGQHPFDRPEHQGAAILLVNRNFGCGSSREHAPWALDQYGFRAVIAPSFADIFFNNCFKNGILPIVLPQEQVDVLMKDAEKGANARIEIDLESQTITSSDGDVFSFEVDAFKKHCLMNGLDDIGLTMEKAASIDSFEATASQSRPWV